MSIGDAVTAFVAVLTGSSGLIYGVLAFMVGLELIRAAMNLMR